MEMFLNRSCKLKSNLTFILEILKLLTAEIKKLQLTVQNGAGCCMYPFDVISIVA